MQTILGNSLKETYFNLSHRKFEGLRLKDLGK
jgi:hypothetical protein